MTLQLTLRLLSGTQPIELDAPFTVEHLRERISRADADGTGEDDWVECEANGVEYISVYNADGRCLLDDDPVHEDEEYMLYIHTVPIQRYYLEDTDEVLELEIGENPTADQVYDTLIEVLRERNTEDAENTEERTGEMDLRLSLRVGGMSLFGWDDTEPLTGREIAVEWREHAPPWELE